MADSEAALLEEDRHFVRLLRLNRSEKKNALSDEWGWAILAAIERAAHEDAIWLIGIAGEGDAFYSGVDLAPDRAGGDDAFGLSKQDGHLDHLGWVGRLLPAL
jgi:enoyl-CoA hydratase/carnithine racemase